MTKFAAHYLNKLAAAAGPVQATPATPKASAPAKPAAPILAPIPVRPNPKAAPMLQRATDFNRNDPLAQPKIIKPVAPKMPPTAAAPLQRTVS